MLPERGSFALATKTPLRVKLLRVCCNLFQVIITPSEERDTAWASTPTNRLIKRPLLIECSKTSDESEHETTTPRSELTQQQRISLWWPRRTCMGPSIRCLLLLSADAFAGVLLPIELPGVPIPLEGSMVPVREVNALCILQSSIVVSWDPVTRKLLSDESARQVTGAQCPEAVSNVFAPSDESNLILPSTCPPSYNPTGK